MKNVKKWVADIAALSLALAFFAAMPFMSCSNAGDGPSVLPFVGSGTQSDSTGGTPGTQPEKIDPALKVPLTLEAIEAGAVVTFSNKAEGNVTYKVNGGEAQTIASGESKAITLEKIGDTVQFFGDNKVYASHPWPSNDWRFKSYTRSYIDCSADCYVYGNIMSLTKSENFAKAEFAENISQAFFGLFAKNTHIKNKDGSDLLLPAKTATNECYKYMFMDCAGLTKAPELPATKLDNSCYCNMFEGCVNLAAAPALPATTLAERCYESMFKGCSSLTTAPALPATTLAERCYESMFYGCAGLTAAPALPATTLTARCYLDMFRGCASLTAAPALPATSLAEYCYCDMFEDCVNLTAAPVLPATTLAARCYISMFSSCRSLTAAPALPATSLAERCYESMFSGCERLTAAPALPATSLAARCYSGMFGWCSKLSKAPTLPATNLEAGCYQQMFYGCINLSSVTCLATDISAKDCVSSWLLTVKSSGTFTKAASMTSWTQGKSGIPDNWTIKNYGE